MKTQHQSTNNINFLSALTLIFITLKLTHYIDWPWPYILLPIWFWIPLALIFFVFIFLKTLIKELINYKKNN